MQASEGDTPRTQWLRGVLDLCLLAVVDAEPAYGYEMTRRLAAAGLEVAGGSIYPALARLRRDHLVEVYEQPGDGGPPRTYYRTTAAGRQTLARWRGAWTEFTAGVDRTLTPPGGANPTTPGGMDRTPAVPDGAVDPTRIEEVR